MAMILVVDDKRNFDDAHLVARSGEAAALLMKLLNERSETITIDLLYLDHDLGDTISGYEIACMIEEGRAPRPEIIRIVSDNSPGIRNIQAALRRHYTIGPDGRTCYLQMNI